MYTHCVFDVCACVHVISTKRKKEKRDSYLEINFTLYHVTPPNVCVPAVCGVLCRHAEQGPLGVDDQVCSDVTQRPYRGISG